VGVACAVAVHVGLKAAGICRSKQERQERVISGEINPNPVPMPGVLLIGALLVEGDRLPAGVRGSGIGPGQVVARSIEPAVIEGNNGNGQTVNLEGRGHAYR
jgi:hypothetical protein